MDLPAPRCATAERVLRQGQFRLFRAAAEIVTALRAQLLTGIGV